MANQSNSSRAFAEVVTVEAWYQSDAEDGAVADLHADVVFHTARLGGEPESRVDFRLSLKRAELVLVVNEAEPIQVIRPSIHRGITKSEVTRDRSIEKKSSTALRGRLKVRPSTAPQAEAEATVEGGKEYTATDTVKMSEQVGLITVQQSITSDGHYRWAMSPSGSGVLEGRPWNPDEVPRCRVKDLRKPGSVDEQPVVSFEIRCLREDLLISDITLKDTNKWKALQGRISRNNLAAAESFIRDRLAEEGLEFGQLDNRFAQLILARILAHHD